MDGVQLPQGYSRFEEAVIQYIGKVYTMFPFIFNLCLIINLCLYLIKNFDSKN